MRLLQVREFLQFHLTELGCCGHDVFLFSNKMGGKNGSRCRYTNIVQHSSTDFFFRIQTLWREKTPDVSMANHGEVLLKHSDVPFAEEILTCAGLLLAKAGPPWLKTCQPNIGPQIVFGFGFFCLFATGQNDDWDCEAVKYIDNG